MGALQDLEQLIEELTDRGISLRLTTNGGLSVYPSAALNKNLRKRIKKHKRDIIEMLRGAAAAGAGEQEVKLPRCRACDGLIPHDAPYVSVEQDGSGKQEPYHASEECQTQGAARTASKLRRGEVWWIHLVHACGDEENGYNCSGGCFR